jgi:hypothetical protein
MPEVRPQTKDPMPSRSTALRLLPALAALALLAGARPAAALGAKGSIALLPGTITLTGPKARQRLLVEERAGAANTADLTSKARFISSNPRVAVVAPDGTVRPVADGTAVVTAVLGGRRGSAPVRVTGARGRFAWSFANDVEPVLTKMGCNSGACHGASAGKGGLKLTLRGFDPEADHATLTRQALGRRVVPTDPGRSLLLQKPSAAVPHGGGQRFKPDSTEYGLIYQWIAAGSPPPAASDAAITGLEVFPRDATLKPGQRQQVLVRARYSDGRTKDVSPWVKFGTSDDSVAGVDDSGLVTVKGSGEAAITLWYQSRVAFARIASPFPVRVAGDPWAKSERHNFVDDLVLRKLKALGIPPSAQATDAEFIRRAYLDAAGILPTPEETQRFLTESASAIRHPSSVGTNGARMTNDVSRIRNHAGPLHPSSLSLHPSRAKLVDHLLSRPEFADYWAYKWSDLLLVSSRKLPAKAMWSFYGWIRDSVAENKPWDRFVRELLTATGSNLKNGAANYFVLHKDPTDLNETTSQAFLGMSLTCSRCHNHPLEKWTLNDYYGMANLFGRVRQKNGDTPGETLVFASDQGDFNHIRTGMPVPPRPLDAPGISLDTPGDRRAVLAEWLTSPKNPYFARSLVNRVWRNFMGRGLVEAEDDLRLTNPPSNEELLAALTQDFVSHGFDVKHLIRTIMGSAAYQRSSVARKENAHDQKYYSTYLPRRLPAEVLLDSISQVTGVPTDFAGYAKGTRALQLADSQVASYFLTAFGRPERVQTCSCERMEEPNIAQALHLSNGDTINGKLRAPGGTIDKLLAESLTDEALLERLYALAFARPPTPREREKILPVLREASADPKTRREAVEDVLAAMLTTKEFLFNH